MDLTESTAHTLVLTERAVKLANELSPAIGAYWDEIHARLGEDLENHDFGATCKRMGGVLRSLQAQLLVAAIGAEIEPGRKSRRLVRRIQQRVGYWIDRLRGLLLLSRFDAEAESLVMKRTYFRPIRGLRQPPEEAGGPAPARAAELVRAMRQLEPQALFEAHMGMLAMAGFPDRPSSPQQQRRKRRRRRRSNPGAPTASCRPDRGYEDD